MKIFILVLILSLNLYGGNIKFDKIIKEFNKNAKPHLQKRGCLIDTLKYIKKHKLKPYIYIENQNYGHNMYCNSFWIVEDKKRQKYYSIRTLVEIFSNFKEYQKSIKAKFISKNRLKAYKKRKEVIWWIYQKEILKTDFEIIKKNLKKVEKINYCEDELHYKGAYNLIGKLMSLQGRIVIGYPKMFKLDYRRKILGVLDEKCEKIKEIGEFVIYLFDGNKDINQGWSPGRIDKVPYKNKLIYEKIERDNKKLNAKIAKYSKIGLIKFLNFYKKYVVKNGDK